MTIARSIFVSGVIFAVLNAAPCNGQTLVWDGGGAFDNWSNTLNWNPNTLPGIGNDIVIDNPVDTTLDQDFSIRGLDLTAGGTADTNGNFLEVGNGGIDIAIGGRLIVSEHNSGSAALRTTGLNVNNIGTMEMAGGRANIAGSININGGGNLTGYGNINFLNGLTVPATIFTNNGTLSTGRAAAAAPSVPFTLRIGANDADARIDLDGTNNNRPVTLAENTTLDLDMKALDFGGTLTMNAGTLFDADDSLQMTNSSVVEVNASTINLGVPDIATIRATAYNALNGSTLNVNSGTLVMDSPFFFNANASLNMASFTGLRFDRAGTIEGSLNLGSGSNIVVNDDVTIVNSSFELDGSNAVSVDYQINAGATLTVDANQVRAAGQAYRGDILVDGGILDTTFSAGDFEIGTNGGLVLDGSTANAVVRGDRIDMRGTLGARGGNVPRTLAPITFRTGSKWTVEDATDLFFVGPVTFDGGSTHTGTGSGEVSFGGNITVLGATSIDMPNGRVQLDSNNATQTLTVDDDLTINAISLQSSVGTSGGGNYTIDIDTTDATLEMNLSNGSWTLGGDGTINIAGSGTLQTSIAGSRLNVQGRINVNDSTRFTAPIDLQSGAILTLNDSLTMNGGTSTDPNRISGGFISGNNQQLLSTGNRALVGFGTINPDIHFSAGSDLFAEGGSLVLNGMVTNADQLGARTGGTLQLNNPLNTSAVNVLFLDGGTVVGQPINNDGTIRGHGTLRSIGLTSTGTISAEGGTLTIDTTNAPDLDGFASTTVLNALTGDLVVVPSLTDDFAGSLNIAAGRTIDFQSGWIQGIASDMVMTGTATQPATLEGGTTLIRGDIAVNGRGLINAPTTFDAFSEITLANFNDLLTVTANSQFEAGATLAGMGALVNDGATMTLDDLVTLGAVVANRGTLEIAGNGVGKVSLEVLDLLAGSSLEIDINGINSFDTISFGAGANIDGSLNVALNGFTPSLGDAFAIIASTNGAAVGNFATTNLPALPGNLNWRVNYTGQTISLEVTDAVSGDFNNDGDYACDDVDALVSVIATGTNDPNFDLTGDGNVDIQDLDAWLAEAGAAELVSGNPYLRGDANLDGVVDGQDFLEWNQNKFTLVAEWCSGDFNADGSVDGQDFIVWNNNKFMTADHVTEFVPEPTFGGWLACFLLMILRRHRR